MKHEQSLSPVDNEWLAAYLERIGLAGGPALSQAGSLVLLSAICLNHVQRIPFENLAIFLTGTVSLEPTELSKKLVHSKRGGWCFEQNAILSLTLQVLGFRHRSLMARNVLVADRPRTHQIVLVEAEEKLYLCDVGFGGIVLRAPLELKHGAEAVQDGLPFRLEERRTPADLAEGPYWILQVMHESAWKDIYRFTLETATPADFAVGNHYHVSSSRSSFPTARIVTMPTPGGRASLTDRRLRLHRNTPQGEILVEEREIDSPDAYARVLSETFALSLSTEEVRVLYALEPAKNLVNSGS